MKKILCAALVAGLAFGIHNASAGELWNPALRGVDEGLAAGALPPKGVYFINDLYMGEWKLYNGSGSYAGGADSKLSLAVDIPIMLWNPGVKVWGADYALAVAQPFDYTHLSPTSQANAHVGTFNTVVVPGMLSWTLPADFHIKTGLAIYVDDASSSPAHPAFSAPTVSAGSGNGFWTLEPDVALSWLSNGWNLSADLRYDYNFEDSTTHYDSGNMIALNYTATKTIGKWTVGGGAYQENQLGRDSLNGTSLPDTTRETYGAGPILGYDFGPVNLSATYNFNIMTHHDYGGDFMNIRLIAPLY